MERKMQFRVYHLTDTRERKVQEMSHNYALLDVRRDASKATSLFQMPDGSCEYRLVAELDASGADEVFERTNTIDKPWWTNPGVTRKFVGHGCRSTSVGDVIVDNGGAGFFCASVGWVAIDVGGHPQDAEADQQVEAEEPSWDFVCGYFGLDTSFQYSDQQCDEYYTQLRDDRGRSCPDDPAGPDGKRPHTEQLFFGVWSDVSWPWHRSQPLCRVLIDVSSDTLVAAQVFYRRKWEALSEQECIDVAQSLFDEHDVSSDPAGNGFAAVKSIPEWAAAGKVMVSRKSRSVAAVTAAITEHSNALGIEGGPGVKVWHLVASLQEYCVANGVDLDAKLADVRKRAAAAEI